MTTELSDLNKDWNICGFASTLTALYQQRNSKEYDRRQCVK